MNLNERIRNLIKIPKRNAVVPVKRNNTEILLNNHLNEELQKFLKPLNLLQNLFLLPKYKIRGNFITPNDLKCKLKCLGIALLFTVLVIYKYFNRNIDIFGLKVNITFKLISLSNYVFCIVNVVLIEIQTIFQSGRNVVVVVLIKDIYGFIKRKNLTLKKLILSNWIGLVLMLFSTYIVYIAFHVYLKYFDIFDLFRDTVLMVSLFNMMYTVAIIKLLKIFLEEVTDRIRSMQDDSDTDDLDYDQISLTYEKILRAFKIHSKSFQYAVSDFNIFFPYILNGSFQSEYTTIVKDTTVI